MKKTCTGIYSNELRFMMRCALSHKQERHVYRVTRCLREGLLLGGSERKRREEDIIRYPCTVG